MATKFQIKRTSVSGRTPNTADPANTSYIASGELAVNLTDQKLFSSNGTTAFEVGANLTNLVVSNSISANQIILTTPLVELYGGTVTYNVAVISKTSATDTLVWAQHMVILLMALNRRTYHSYLVKHTNLISLMPQMLHTL